MAKECAISEVCILISPAQRAYLNIAIYNIHGNVWGCTVNGLMLSLMHTMAIIMCTDAIK